MYVGRIYVRFFRSFNFDYMRELDKRVDQKPWEIKDGKFYPFVSVKLEESITAVVGANESGKSQLIDAVKFGLTGVKAKRGDFCRYSYFFAVDREMAYPDFGLGLRKLSPDEVAVVRTEFDVPDEIEFTSAEIFRMGGKTVECHVQTGETWESYQSESQEALISILPHVFEIDRDVAIPDSVPVEGLAYPDRDLAGISRGARKSAVQKLIDGLAGEDEDFDDTVAEAAKILRDDVQGARRELKGLRLADDLLVKVAEIDRSAFQELFTLINDGDDGYANGIVERINRGLAKGLNFPKWWSQDHRFELRVSLRDFELVFTIRDRTGTEYAFGERSGGMRYFLSYFVQYLAHELDRQQPEILLMDEPDAFLSSQGQQDLLRVFEEYSTKRADGLPSQVLYVTHSPFLIDKNHGERIRVLEKGEGDEGTRVVRDVSRNHYEPLRSSFGSFVAETTFISNCNLFMEGTADQVLVAGMAARLNRPEIPESETLDLNSITLVPAGSASQIPYLVHIARGRDVTRPAVIVLLDADGAGSDAKKALLSTKRGRRPLVVPEWILLLNEVEGFEGIENPAGVVDIEDLVPLRIGWAATVRYTDEVVSNAAAKKLAAVDATSLEFRDGEDTHDLMERRGREIVGSDFGLDKIGFAKCVMETVRDCPYVHAAEIELMEQNFRMLFKTLKSMQRLAMASQQRERNDSKIKRLAERFDADHVSTATREDALLILEEIERELDEGIHTKQIRNEIHDMRLAFNLTTDLPIAITELDSFKQRLRALPRVELHASQLTSTE